MSTDIRAAYIDGLRVLAELLENYPGLPAPFVFGSGPFTAAWYLHIDGLGLVEQKATAGRIVTGLGGTWDKAQWDERFVFNQVRGELILSVTVARDAVCERVVTGTHEVTVPASPAIPAQDATTERVETVEDVKWICSSLLGGAS